MLAPAWVVATKDKLSNEVQRSRVQHMPLIRMPKWNYATLVCSHVEQEADTSGRERES